MTKQGLHWIATEQELYWIAGILEGEGSFQFDKRRTTPAPRVIVDMTDKDVILKLQKITQLGSVAGPYRDKRCETWKQMWRWDVSARCESVAIIQRVYLLLGKRRRKQIRLVLRKCGMRINKQLGGPSWSMTDMVGR